LRADFLPNELSPAFRPWRRGFFFLLSAIAGGAVASDR
jgi:hypothetical protein